MSIRRARPLQQLYDAVADHDVVVVPDNPLADAINRRVETPQFGTFATTPRRLATGRRERAEDRLAFLEVVDRTDHAWKAVSYAVGNVLQCWEHQGSAEAILDYEAYADEAARDVVEALADLQTTSGQLADYTIDESESVAVVGYDQLTELERSILPAEFDRVDLFADGAFDHPPFNVFESSADVVDALLDTVSEETAEDVAVVLDSGSRYSSLVESALETAGVPYYGGPGFADDPDHRAFVRLLRTAYRGSETTVADVRPICTRTGVEVPVEHDRKRLEAVDLPALDWVSRFCADARAGSLTFDEALGEYEAATGRSLADFREELSALGLLGDGVDRRRVEDLAYYLATYEVPVERENEGVLLADAKSAGYVDRPAVFFLGMDESWTHSAPRRPWVGTDAQFDRRLRQFQLLLQSGTEQYYLVQDTAGGQPVTPCLYFGELLDAEFDRFSDLDSVSHTRHRGDGGGGFEKEPLGIEPSRIDAISQSSLNSYANSPRDYFFGRLLDVPDRDYFREGNLFHDFAEFYVAHPDLVDDAAIDDAVDAMLAEAGEFFHDSEEPLRRRKYRIGLETIVEFLDDQPPEDHDFLTGSSGWGSNFFADHFGQPVDSPLTERWFEDADLGVKGKIDLVRAADHLVDYKSGYRKSEYDVVRSAAVDPPDDTPNFQAALYLSYFRTQQPDSRIEFTFFHFLETMDDVVAGTADLQDAITSVTYFPHSFDAFVESREAYQLLLDGYSDCVETFDDLGFERYRDVVGGFSFPETTDRDELRDSSFAAEFAAAVDAETGDVDAEKGCDQAIRELDGVRKRVFFEEDLDAFEDFLTECVDEINHCRAGEERFPVDGPGGEPNYRRVDHRDLLLEGQRDD